MFQLGFKHILIFAMLTLASNQAIGQELAFYGQAVTVEHPRHRAEEILQGYVVVEGPLWVLCTPLVEC